MEKFFAANTHLENKWWTIDGDPSAGVATGRVRPMEAFFVKTTAPATDVSFSKDMMVDGNDGTVSPSRWYVQLEASTGGTTSTATLELSDTATTDYVEDEDVETLFDSNLADVPMVYTVSADGQAVSINKLPELKTVPFGVTCSGNEAVQCTLHLSPSTSTVDLSHLYVFDALLGTTTPIGDGENFSVQPNDYGRYYLTTNEKIGSKVTDGVAEGIVVSVRQDGIVTVTSNSQIAQVRAININGVTAYGQTDCGTSTTFQLQPGTYVIDVESNAGKQKIKIIVK